MLSGSLFGLEVVRHLRSSKREFSSREPAKVAQLPLPRLMLRDLGRPQEKGGGDF